MTTPNLTRDQRVEFRATVSDRALFVRAARASGTDLSTFANDSLRAAAQQVLADRSEFALSPVEAAQLNELMDRPARDLPGLRALLDHPSPFIA